MCIVTHIPVFHIKKKICYLFSFILWSNSFTKMFHFHLVMQFLMEKPKPILLSEAIFAKIIKRESLRFFSRIFNLVGVETCQLSSDECREYYNNDIHDILVF